MPETKIKPRFNIIDVIVILAVIAAAAGIGYKLMYKPIQESAAKQFKVALTVRVKNIAPELAESFVNNVPGDCISGLNVVDGSVVRSATIEPAKWLSTDSNGMLVEYEDPYRVDVVAIVEGISSDLNDVYMVGNQECRINRSFWIKTDVLEYPGTIEAMTVTDADAG